MRVFRWLFGLLFFAFALFTIQPAWFGPLSQLAISLPVAQLFSFRGIMAASWAGLALLAGLLGLLLRIWRRGKTVRRFALICALVAGCHGGIIFARGIDKDELSPTSSPNTITLLQYNTEGGNSDMDSVADLITEHGVQVASLVETSTKAGQELVAKLEARGRDFQLFTQGVSQWESDWRSSVLLVDQSLGQYAEMRDDATGFPARTLTAFPTGNGAQPAFVSVHPVAPVPKYMSQWREDVERIYNLCEEYPQAIILGDFNSTADHQKAMGAGGQCADLMVQAGAGGRGTWPSTFPSFFASPIDRIMSSGNYRGVEGSVLPPGGSDHRAIVLRITQEK